MYFNGSYLKILFSDIIASDQDSAFSQSFLEVVLDEFFLNVIKNGLRLITFYCLLDLLEIICSCWLS